METRETKISIVMPTFNRGYTIQNAIRSILDQTFKEFELIIVSDGSTDETERIVNGFVSPKIRYYNIPHTGHISSVRNYGNTLALGELIVVQDSDDVSLPDRLEWIWKYFIEHKKEVDLIYHDMYTMTVDPYLNAVKRGLRRIGEYKHNKLLHEQYIPGQVAYTKRAITKWPYDDRITVSDDFQMLIEFSLNKATFGYIDRPLYEYRMHSEGANVQGELDGRRFEDTRVIVQILKKKYGIDAVGELKKWETMTGKILRQDYVS